jgi:hypothetical protein
MGYQVEQKDFEMRDYFCVLRESVLEAYTGIVQGLKGPDTNKAHQDIMLLQNHVPLIVKYIVQTAQDPELSESTMTSCAGLIGDLCAAFGAALLPYPLKGQHRHAYAHGGKEIASITHKVDMQLGSSRHQGSEAICSDRASR